MKRKIVAVINDQTGRVEAALDGYQSRLPFSGVPSKYIEFEHSYGDSMEYRTVRFDFFGFVREVSNENYSLVYEEGKNELALDKGI